MGVRNPSWLLHLVAVPADQLGGLLHVAERLEPALADLEGHEGGQVEHPLLHDVGHPAQDAHALLPPHPIPGELERPRGRNRVVHVGARRLREPADDDVLVDRGGLLVHLVAPALFAVHDHGVGLAEFGAGALDSGIVGSLQLLVVRRHRGVGDAELLGHRGNAPFRTETWTQGRHASRWARATPMAPDPPSVEEPTFGCSIVASGGRTLRSLHMRLVTYDRGGQRRLGASSRVTWSICPTRSGTRPFPPRSRVSSQAAEAPSWMRREPRWRATTSSTGRSRVRGSLRRCSPLRSCRPDRWTWNAA